MPEFITRFISRYAIDIYFPEVYFTDILEILILTFLLYHLIVWMKNTKAWMLLKGIFVLAIFILIAAILQMHTILFIAKNLVTVMATAIVVVFQPELRRALEYVGRSKLVKAPFGQLDKEKAKAITDEFVKAVSACSSTKTGALILTALLSLGGSREPCQLGSLKE